MYKLFMAFRYLRAHKIIYFSITGVAIGTLALVMVTSIMGGFSRDMRARIRGLQTDLVVTSADRSLWFPDYEDLCAAIAKVPRVRGCAPRIEWAAWLGRRGIRRDVQVVGIVPERERAVSEIERYFREGGKRDFDFKPRYGAESEAPGLVLGCELWGMGLLHLQSVRDASPMPIPCGREFEAAGNFKTGMAEYDSNYVFMELSAAQRFLNLEKPSANVLAVKVEDYERDGRAVRRAIFDLLHARKPCLDPAAHVGSPGSPGHCGTYRVMTWEQTRSILLQAVEVEKGIQIILLFLIVLVAGFNIIAIYTLVVRSKTRDIGILRALGATEEGIVSVFLTSGGLCGLVGSVFGIVLGLLMAYNVNGISDFIRVVSRELNRMAFAAMPPGESSRAGLAAAGVALFAAGAAVIWNWLVFYKARRPHPWGRMAAGLLALGAAAFLSTTWLPTYEIRDARFDPALGVGGQWKLVAVVAGIWVFFMAAWRLLDRWRRRPAWIFFGFAGTIVLSALFLAVLATFLVAFGLLLARPGPEWPGLELFPRQIYYLDRIPVFVDYGTLAFIVAATLVVSVVFSIYPALRAAACDPIEAIRDE